MESRPDLKPPCCGGCDDAVVEWDEQAGWIARHGSWIRPATSGVEAMYQLRDMHYAPPEPVAAEPVTSTIDIDLGDHHG